VSAPIPLRVVIVALFEPEERPDGLNDGELRRWVARLPLPETQPFGFGRLHLDAARGLAAITTGVGNAAGAAAVAALGTDPRFDTRAAYWLLAGIAGADPDAMALGSAAWLDHVVDGDLMHEVHHADAPAHWPTGRIPLGRDAPYAMPPREGMATNRFVLNAALAEWAWRLTRAAPLADTAELAAYRAHFAGFAKGGGPPEVLRGSVLASSNFWHGPALLGWAREWVAYWTEGRGRFVASAMEDAGVAHALAALDRAGRADWQRVLMLRTASNFVIPRPGLTAEQSLGSHRREGFSGFGPALENAYRVGRPVVDALLAGVTPSGGG
jgi:purine nucleoside permease